MRAMVIAGTGGPEVFERAELPLPMPVQSELLVKITAAGVNPIDAKTRSGAASVGVHFPLLLGQDFSGIVVKSPFEACAFRPGDEVFGMVTVPRLAGCYAEYVAVPTLSVAKKPTRITHLEAAGVPLAALTAWGAVVEVAKAHAGQRMLIHAGAGGVGHFAVQFASYFGAHVIATGSGDNLPWLRTLGAAQVIDYSTTRFEQEVANVDVVIDLIGNIHDSTGTRSLATLRAGGLLVNVPSGSWPTLLADAAAAGIRATTFKVAPDGATLAVIGRLLESGDIQVAIDGVFALDDVAQAHAALESGHTRGKIVLNVAN